MEVRSLGKTLRYRACYRNKESIRFDTEVPQTGCFYFLSLLGLSWWLSGKEFVCNVGDADTFFGLGRSSREGNGNPLQYYCLGNPMNRGA